MNLYKFFLVTMVLIASVQRSTAQSGNETYKWFQCSSVPTKSDLIEVANKIDQGLIKPGVKFVTASGKDIVTNFPQQWKDQGLEILKTIKGSTVSKIGDEFLDVDIVPWPKGRKTTNLGIRSDGQVFEHKDYEGGANVWCVMYKGFIILKIGGDPCWNWQFDFFKPTGWQMPTQNNNTVLAPPVAPYVAPVTYIKHDTVFIATKCPDCPTGYKDEKPLEKVEKCNIYYNNNYYYYYSHNTQQLYYFDVVYSKQLFISLGWSCAPVFIPWTCPTHHCHKRCDCPPPVTGGPVSPPIVDGGPVGPPTGGGPVGPPVLYTGVGPNPWDPPADVATDPPTTGVAGTNPSQAPAPVRKSPLQISTDAGYDNTQKPKDYWDGTSTGGSKTPTQMANNATAGYDNNQKPKEYWDGSSTGSGNTQSNGGGNSPQGQQRPQQEEGNGGDNQPRNDQPRNQTTTPSNTDPAPRRSTDRQDTNSNPSNSQPRPALRTTPR